VLVTGAAGRLGRELVAAFAGHEVVARSRRELDVADEAAVAATVADVGPELVLNAAALTDVDVCEEDPVGAHRVNALGPWWLARACDRIDATLLHVSTDAVFGGATPLDADGRPRPITEFDPVAPVSAYGRSKAAGEHLVRTTLRRHHVVRVAWVLDREGTDFAGAILRRARDQGRVEVVTDQTGSPTFVGDLGPALRAIAVSGRHGTWHRTGGGPASRVDLAREVLRVAGVDAEVVPVAPSDRGDRAPRPSWSVLDALHTEAAGFAPLPGWREVVAAAQEARTVAAGRHASGAGPDHR
jgi:dTDP-4-dehydrorhamnose reductase